MTTAPRPAASTASATVASPAPSQQPATPNLLAAMAAQGWSLWHLLAVAALVAAGVLLTERGWRDLVWLSWYDEESSQILVVPVVLVWLFWARRRRLAQIRPGFSLLGPAFLALGWAAWEISYYDSMRVAGHIAALALAVGGILSVTGGRFFWRFLPVFGALIFAIPVPHTVRMPISVPLQRVTALITEHLMQAFGVAVTRAGSVLTVNGVDVGVAEACNGMRMVFALFLVAYLFAFSTRLHPAVRILVLALCPLLALACNVIRLVPTVYLYGYASETTAEAFHDLSGWAMIGVAFLLMLGITRLLRWTLAREQAV